MPEFPAKPVAPKPIVPESVTRESAARASVAETPVASAASTSESLPERLRRAVAEGVALRGALVSVRSPEVAEALALAGAEWLFVDLEHSLVDYAAAQAILQAVAGRVPSVLRLPMNAPEHFKRALDTGCEGVLVPMIRSAAEARAAVEAARYPPVGSRSVGIGRAHGYGYSFAEYTRTANERVALILQIEHIDAVRELEGILALCRRAGGDVSGGAEGGVPGDASGTVQGGVPGGMQAGVDALFLGPYDLSGSLGVLGQIDHPSVVEAMATVRAACARHGVPLGIFCATAEQAALEAARGASFVTVGTDLGLMTRALKDGLSQM